MNECANVRKDERARMSEWARTNEGERVSKNERGWASEDANAEDGRENGTPTGEENRTEGVSPRDWLDDNNNYNNNNSNSNNNNNGNDNIDNNNDNNENRNSYNVDGDGENGWEKKRTMQYGFCQLGTTWESDCLS